MSKNSLHHKRLWTWFVCGLVLIFSQTVAAEQYAILVGIWDYENPNLQLDAPRNDLELMRSLLSSHGIAEENLHVLTNPGKVKIQQEFRKLSRRLTASDSLLFYFSGHGTRIIDKFGSFPGDEAKGRYPDQNDEALMPADVKLASPETYLLDDELNVLLSEFQTREITCVIDTCYSGDILRDLRLGKPKGAPVTNTPPDSAQHIPVLSRAEDILDQSAEFAVLLAAAAYNQVVHELRIPIRNDYLSVSAMTYSLYRRLMGQSKLTYRQLVGQMQTDHQMWNLAWMPVLEGLESRFDEDVFESPPSPLSDKPLNLVTITGRSIKLKQRDLIFAGGRDFQLGASRTPDMRRWAIVIGIDAYPSPFQSLKYAGSDAKAVRDVFQDAGFVVTLMTPDSLIQPTKANIVEQLERHAQLEEVDLLMIYLSGHGEDVNGTGYFLPMDVAEPLAEKGISLEDLFSILSTANAKDRFIIVDACRVAPKQHFVAALSRYSEESNIIFTACDSNQWAPEVPRLKHGLFTYFLLKGLRGEGEGDRGAAADDGTVTVLGLLDYVTRGIEAWHAHLPTDLHMPQQITPRVFYHGKYISLLNNQGINPMVLNNQGFASRAMEDFSSRIREWVSPLEGTQTEPDPNTGKSYTHMPVTVSFKPAQTTEVKIVLEPVAFQLEEVKVTSTPSPPTAGKQTLEALEIKRIPGTAGDALRALGALPGYNSTLNER